MQQNKLLYTFDLFSVFTLTQIFEVDQIIEIRKVQITIYVIAFMLLKNIFFLYVCIIVKLIYLVQKQTNRTPLSRQEYHKKLPFVLLHGRVYFRFHIRTNGGGKEEVFEAHLLSPSHQTWFSHNGLVLCVVLQFLRSTYVRMNVSALQCDQMAQIIRSTAI